MRSDVERFVREHLGHLVDGPIVASPSILGGQAAANAALARFEVTGYARRRSTVEPAPSRGASGLSPYIRHGLLRLQSVWDAVEGGPVTDVKRFRDELLWQEYARHWYARLGAATQRPTRRVPRDTQERTGWDRTLACLDATVGELEREGWIPNQARMWLASDWCVRHGQDWRAGEDLFFRHLLDGSRAANRLGWQWTTGVGASKSYGFSRWQVEKRAATLCRACPRRERCPIEDWPTESERVAARWPSEVDRTGPRQVPVAGRPERVWLTAESLGLDDAALAANPSLPVVFVFDEPLLARLRLSGKRLIFLAETLAELGQSRELEVRLGEPAGELVGLRLAVTHAPVPGFGPLSARLAPVETHPWPWLLTPGQGSVRSFSAWRKSVTRG